MLIRVTQARQQAIEFATKLEGGLGVVGTAVRTYFVDLFKLTCANDN